MTDRRRQTNAGLAATVLLITLLVLSSVGAAVLVGTAPVAAQSNESGGAAPEGGSTTGAPPGSGSGSGSGGETGNESGGDGGSGSGTDTGSFDRVESALPDSGSGAGAESNATGNETSNETGNESGSSGGSSTYQPEGNDDNGMFSISIDPIGLLIRFFEPFFTFGTDMLVSMAEAMQSGMVYPMQDGSVAISGQPDSELMSILHDYWYGVSLVAAAAIWLVMVIVLYIMGAVWPPTPTYQQIKVAQQEAWIKLVMIPFSWAIGTVILFLASFVLNAIPLDPEVITPDTSSIAANNAAAGISVLLLYAFGGPFALAIAFTFFVTWVFVYIMFPALPILIAMSVPKVWIMHGLAESFENVVEKFPSAAFFPVPAVIVLSVGYTIIGAIEELLPGPTEWGAVPVSAVAIVVIWILAFTASMYMFWSKSLGSGAGAILAGTVGIGAISSALGRLGGGAAAGGSAAAGAAGGAAGGTASSLTSGVEKAVDGHALGSGSSAATSEALGAGSGSSGLPSGSNDLDSAGGGAPATAGTSTGTNSSGTAIPSGSGSGSGSGAVAGSSGPASDSSSGVSSGSAAASEPEGSMPGRVPVDDPSITPVESEEQLPDQEYRVGYFTGTGPGSDMEFQKTLEISRPTEQISGEMYTRANEVYEDRDLFVRGQEDQQYYDVDPLHEAKGNLNLSEAEQHAESRSTVSESRGF